MDTFIFDIGIICDLDDLIALNHTSKQCNLDLNAPYFLYCKFGRHRVESLYRHIVYYKTSLLCEQSGHDIICDADISGTQMLPSAIMSEINKIHRLREENVQIVIPKDVRVLLLTGGVMYGYAYGTLYNSAAIMKDFTNKVIWQLIYRLYLFGIKIHLRYRPPSPQTIGIE